jgi:hypothetical protein
MKELIEKLEAKLIELGFVQIYTWGNGNWNGIEGKTYKNKEDIPVYAYLNHKGEAWFQYGTIATSDSDKLHNLFNNIVICVKSNN